MEITTNVEELFICLSLSDEIAEIGKISSLLPLNQISLRIFGTYLVNWITGMFESALRIFRRVILMLHP